MLLHCNYIFGGFMYDKLPYTRITLIPEKDDTTFTFRVSSALKEDFAEICRKEHLSAATALKRYMTRCVSKGRIVN